MNELALLEAWLTSQISSVAEVVSDCGGRVFIDEIPQTEAPPAVVFQIIDGEDVNVQMATRCGTEVLVNITVHFEGLDRTPAHTVASAIDAAIHKLKEIDGNYEFDCYRTGPISTQFVIGGVTTQVSGGRYTVWVRVDQS